MPIEANCSGSQSSAICILKERLSNFETSEGRLHGLNYQPRWNDVGISTTPKAGTTWMQQICHQIRCAAVPLSAEGCMDFEEISDVVPWIELAFDLGQDLEAEQPPEGHDNLPRLFKTHCWYDHCPRFPKTIVVLRDPCDVLTSFYRFFEGWFFERGTVEMETFAAEFWLARGEPESKLQNASYFIHLISWYNRRADDSVLILFYEDLLDDLEGNVRRIARFMSNEHYNFAVESVVQHAVSYSTYNFMKTHESQFDERLTKIARNAACGLASDAGMSQTKINTGTINSGKAFLSEKIKAKIQQKWTKVVLPVTGCATYTELREQFAVTEKSTHK